MSGWGRCRRIGRFGISGKLDVREAASGLPEVVQLAENEDSDPGSIPEAGLHCDQFGDQFGVMCQEAET